MRGCAARALCHAVTGSCKPVAVMIPRLHKYTWQPHVVVEKVQMCIRYERTRSAGTLGGCFPCKSHTCVHHILLAVDSSAAEFSNGDAAERLSANASEAQQTIASSLDREIAISDAMSLWQLQSALQAGGGHAASLAIRMLLKAFVPTHCLTWSSEGNKSRRMSRDDVPEVRAASMPKTRACEQV